MPLTTNIWLICFSFCAFLRLSILNVYYFSLLFTPDHFAVSVKHICRIQQSCPFSLCKYSWHLYELHFEMLILIRFKMDIIQSHCMPSTMPSRKWYLKLYSLEAQWSSGVCTHILWNFTTLFQEYVPLPGSRFDAPRLPSYHPQYHCMAYAPLLFGGHFVPQTLINERHYKKWLSHIRWHFPSKPACSPTLVKMVSDTFDPSSLQRVINVPHNSLLLSMAMSKKCGLKIPALGF